MPSPVSVSSPAPSSRSSDRAPLRYDVARAIRGEPITIYGDGFQVRDALFIDDAVAAWLSALDRIDEVSGRVFNLGGGTANTISLREMMALIAELRGELPMVAFAEWRPGDQPWYVSDIRRISAALDWTPKVGLPEGLRALEHWLEKRFGRPTRMPALREARA